MIVGGACVVVAALLNWIAHGLLGPIEDQTGRVAKYLAFGSVVGAVWSIGVLVAIANARIVLLAIAGGLALAALIIESGSDLMLLLWLGGQWFWALVVPVGAIGWAAAERLIARVRPRPTSIPRQHNP
jgi:hypothetical protein